MVVRIVSEDHYIVVVTRKVRVLSICPLAGQPRERRDTGWSGPSQPDGKGPHFHSLPHADAVLMSYKCLYVVLLLLAAAYSTSALTTEEESAVLALLTSFPALASVSPPWSTNASSACDNPPFYGLECTNEPDKHILTLYDSNLPSLHRYFHDPFLASNYLLLASNPRNLFTLTLIYRRFSINGLTGTMPRNISGLLWLEELYVNRFRFWALSP